VTINHTLDDASADHLRHLARTGVMAQLMLAGQDPNDAGLRETPDRVVRAFEQMTSGYGTDTEALLSKRFACRHDEMIVVQGVPFHSLCEHHLLPFHGNATVAYIPNDDGAVCGLSKLARVVEAYARRLQVQERLTQDIATAVAEHLAPRGVGVVVYGRHSCMEARGVCKRAPMVTSTLLGLFRDDPTVRAEFLALARPQ